jgi:hypothetical protein
MRQALRRPGPAIILIMDPAIARYLAASEADDIDADNWTTRAAQAR